MLTSVLSVLILVVQDKKIEYKASAVRRDKDWTFRFEGTTDFPKGTILKGRVYALEETTDPNNGGKVLDEEPFFYGEESWQDTEVEDGKFSMDVYAFRKKPYSLPYRARVLYDPQFQNDEIRKKVGAEKLVKDLDFREGDDARFDAEVRETLKELNVEFEIVKKLFEELKREFAAHQVKHDSKAWDAWLDPWMDRVQAVRDRNDDRLMLWCVWVERQGKLRLEGFCMRLPDLATDCREVLEGNKEVLARAQLKMQTFLDYYEEAIEVVGLEMPLDVDTIGPAIRKYMEQVDRLKKGGSKTEIKRAGMEALLTVAGTFQRRKKGYYRVNQIMVRFTELLKGGADFDGHDREVREFKEYAGLK